MVPRQSNERLVKGVSWAEAKLNSEETKSVHSLNHSQAGGISRNKKFSQNLLEGFGVTLKTFMGLTMLNHAISISKLS